MRENTTRKTVDFSKIYVDTILWISKYVFSKGEGDSSRADKDLFYGNIRKYQFTAKDIKTTFKLLSDSSNRGVVWECECESFEDNDTCWHNSEIFNGENSKEWLLSALYRWCSRTNFIHTIISHPDDSELIMTDPIELRRDSMVKTMEQLEDGIGGITDKLKEMARECVNMPELTTVNANLKKLEINVQEVGSQAKTYAQVLDKKKLIKNSKKVSFKPALNKQANEKKKNVKAVKIMTKMNMKDLKKWIESEKSGIAKYKPEIQELFSTDTNNFRISVCDLPDSLCLYEFGNWDDAKLECRKWHGRIQDLSKTIRIRRLIGGLTKTSKTATQKWIKNKMKSLYDDDTVIYVEEFTGFTHIKDKKFFVVQVTRNGDGAVDDEITSYCEGCNVKVRPWRGVLPNRTSSITELI